MGRKLTRQGKYLQFYLTNTAERKDILERCGNAAQGRYNGNKRAIGPVVAATVILTASLAFAGWKRLR